MGPQTTGQLAVNTTTAPAKSLDRQKYLTVSLSKHTLSPLKRLPRLSVDRLESYPRRQTAAYLSK